MLDNENEISALIAKLQNPKIEVLFEQVKKEIKSENLNVSSESIMPLLEVLRNNRQTVNKTDEIISKENPKTENVTSRLNSISKVVKS